MLSEKYGNLIGPFLGNASERTKTSIAGEIQQGNFAMFTEVADWCCDLSECLKCRIILWNITSYSQVKLLYASMTKDGMLTIRKLSWYSIYSRHYKIRQISRDSVILIVLVGESGVSVLRWNSSVEQLLLFKRKQIVKVTLFPMEIKLPGVNRKDFAISI